LLTTFSLHAIEAEYYWVVQLKSRTVNTRTMLAIPSSIRVVASDAKALFVMYTPFVSAAFNMAMITPDRWGSKGVY
jgi:hypothetical protein